MSYFLDYQEICSINLYEMTFESKSVSLEIETK